MRSTDGRALCASVTDPDGASAHSSSPGRALPGQIRRTRTWTVRYGSGRSEGVILPTVRSGQLASLIGRILCPTGIDPASSRGSRDRRAWPAGPCSDLQLPRPARRIGAQEVGPATESARKPPLRLGMRRHTNTTAAATILAFISSSRAVLTAYRRTRLHLSTAARRQFDHRGRRPLDASIIAGPDSAARPPRREGRNFRRLKPSFQCVFQSC